MRGLKNNIQAKVFAVAVMLIAALPGSLMAESITARPSGLEMAADALLVRPVMLGATIIGTAVFIVSGPFSVLGGNLKESSDTLVKAPFRSTFVRCLGCSAKHLAE